MRLKRIIATATTGALLATAAPAAQAAERPTYNAGEGFVPGDPTSSFTGSTPLDGTIIAISVLTGLKLLTDNIPPLRAELDKLAAQAGLAGSSGSSYDNRMNGGLDFDIERLVRSTGNNELADQIAQFKLVFGPVPA